MVALLLQFESHRWMLWTTGDISSHFLGVKRTFFLRTTGDVSSCFSEVKNGYFMRTPGDISICFCGDKNCFFSVFRRPNQDSLF